MVQTLFEYHQGKDIRWYGGEPTILSGIEAAGVAQAAGETVTMEGNKFISWLKTSTSEGVCYALCAYFDKVTFNTSDPMEINFKD